MHKQWNLCSPDIMLHFTSSLLPPPGGCGEAVFPTHQSLQPHPSWIPWVLCNGHLPKSVFRSNLCSRRPASCYQPMKPLFPTCKRHFCCRNDKVSSHISRGVSVRTPVRAITKSIRMQRQVPAVTYRRTALPLAFCDNHSWERAVVAISGIFEPPVPTGTIQPAAT